MHEFSKSLVKTASELVQDEENIRDTIDNVRNVESLVPNIYESLLKGHWVFHAQRFWLISSRQLLKNRELYNSNRISADEFKICFKKFRVLNGDQYSCYAALIPLLKQNATLLANVMHIYTSVPFIFERLSASVFCSLANFSLESSNSVFLYSVLRELLLISSKSGGPGSIALKELRSSFPVRFFIEGLPDSKRYLSALLCDVVSEISVHTVSTEQNYFRINTSSKSRSLFYCSYHNQSEIPRFVNILINTFKKTIPLFPKSCLLWLHSLRQTLRSSGTSESIMHKITVDHILSFINRGLLNPELFIVSGPYLDPAGHQVLKEITSALNFLAHLNHNAPPTDSLLIQFSSETGIQAAKLLQVCDARKLQVSIESLISNADRVSLVAHSPLDCSSHAKETGFLDLENAPSATPVNPTHSIFMITPTDFNILVDCLRLYMQNNAEGFDELRNILLQLPTRVPGSLIGIQPRRQTFNGHAESASHATSTDNQPYQVVYYDPNSQNNSPPLLKNTNRNFKLNRSRSASRLGVVRAARVAQTDSSSLGRSKSPDLSADPEIAYSLNSLDTPNRTAAQQTVLILQLGNACSSPQLSLLSEAEFQSCRKMLRSSNNDLIKQQHSDPPKLTPANGPFNKATSALTTNCHGHPVSQSSSSSSGSSRFSRDPAEENAVNGDPDVDDCEADMDGGDSSPMRALHYTRLRCRVQAPSIDEQCSQNGLLLDGSTEDLMAEDRSINDPSSDASERSGFTSLASSAHAMRVRVISGLHALTLQEQQQQNRDSELATTSTHARGLTTSHEGTTTLHACHTPGSAPQFGIEKRTRFSQAVLCNDRNAVTGLEPIVGQSDSDVPRQSRDGHSPQGSLEDDDDDAAALSSNRSVDDGAAHTFTRTRTVPRTGSVDLVHTCRIDPVAYGARSNVSGTALALSDRRIDHHSSGSIPCSPSAVRYSSLNSLRLPRSTVGCVPRATTAPADSLQMPATSEYVNETDERSSGITCSSCGVRFLQTADDAEQHDLSTEGSHGEADLHRQLDDSQLAETDQEREAEEDALSDLPDLSSANVSGRVTPSSLTSSTSRGGAQVSTTGPLLGDSPSTTRRRAFNRAGFVLPNGASLPQSTAVAMAAAASGSAVGHGHPGSVRFGMLDFSTSLLHTHGSPDVTDKFGKFDLPVTRMPEAEARSTVSDTWSTDVLPSDTEYPDGGSEYLGPEPSVNRVDQEHQQHHRHHHHHRHNRNPRSVTRRTGLEETDNRDTEDMVNQQPDDSNNHVPHEDHTVSHRSVFCTPMHHVDMPPPSEDRPSIEANTSVHSVALEPPPARSDQTPTILTADDVARRTAVTEALTLNMLDSTALRSPSPALTPLGAVCELETQSTVLPASQTELINRIPKQRSALLGGYSRLKDRIDLISRRTNGTPTNDRAGENLQATTVNDQGLPSTSNVSRENLLDPPYASDQQDQLPITTASGFSQSNHPTSTNSPLCYSKHPSRMQSTSSAGDRPDETVDEMMDRYRRQSSEKFPQPAIRPIHRKSHPSKTSTGTTTKGNSKTATANCGTTGSRPATHGAACGSWSSLTSSVADQLRVQVIRGLRRLFSNPLIHSVLEPISCQLMTTGFASDNPGHLKGCSRQDMFFLTLLDALVADTLISQDTGLTTCIHETKRLLERLLFNTHMVSRDQGSTSQRQPTVTPSWADNPTVNCNQLPSSSGHDSVVAGLLRQLRAERRHRLAYLAYLMEQKSRVTARKRSLTLLRRRCERDLQAQCEYIVHKCVSTFLDSQLETFQAFFTRFAEQRNQSETHDRGASGCADGGDVSVPSQLVSQLISELVEKWEAIEPARRPPILLPVTRLDSGQEDVDPDFAHLASSHLLFARSHIKRLVMEKVYQSGVWMNDASLERESDRVLHRELALLSRVITLSELQVPERFHVFEPFQSVQDELRRLDCSHLPSDMILCLKRVMERIVSTLQLACPDSVPNADDLLPVLIFVILQVNPPRLLTNISFLDLFLDRLDGEDQYVWCQFRSAVSEIRRLLSIVQLDSD